MQHSHRTTLRAASARSDSNCERARIFELPRQKKAASLLLRGPRFVRYETRLSSEEIAGANVEFSRHAARKPTIARYRQMPHGRLEFLVRPIVASTTALGYIETAGI